jgi:hypothetical protein
MSHILENDDFQCMLKTYCYNLYEGILGTHLIWLYSKCGNIVVLCLERFYDLFMNTLQESKILDIIHHIWQSFSSPGCDPWMQVEIPALD